MKGILLFTIFLQGFIVATAKPVKTTYCAQPSEQELQKLIPHEATILRSHFTCLAVRGRDIYHSASVIIQYNTSNEQNITKRFEVECDKKKQSWKSMPHSSGEITTNMSLFDLRTRYDCYKCTNDDHHGHHHHHHHHHHNTGYDSEAHCQECNAACHGWGGGHCKSPSVGSCCPYFDLNGECTKTCPYTNNTMCTNCSLVCYNGGTRDQNCTACLCPVGYTSTQCETQVCSLACENNGTCVFDFNGNMTCNCTKGFQGETCEDSLCENGGNYTIEGDCRCPEGYTGMFCENETCNCLNGGVCVSMGNDDYYCNCSQTGYNGTNCEEEIDICDESPCQNGGTCISTSPGNYECICPPAYTGSNCEKEVNLCDEISPCHNGGTCNDTMDGYICICTPFYTGNDCEETVNPCNPPCLNGGTCMIDDDGLPVCKCIGGWEGDHCQNCNYDYCVPTTIGSVEDGESRIGLILAIVLSVMGALALVSAMLLIAALYKRYKLHKDEIKTANATGDIWDGDKVMVNPVYMTPGLLASGSYPPLQTDNEALVNN